MKNELKPVTIRGVAYPSQRAAADAIGVTPAAISLASKRGRLDIVGLQGNARGRPPVPVTIRGVAYPSQTAAAHALGVNASVISRLAAKGRADHVGLGVGNAPPGYERPGRAIEIGGVRYVSVSAAQRALGRPRRDVLLCAGIVQ